MLFNDFYCTVFRIPQKKKKTINKRNIKLLLKNVQTLLEAVEIQIKNKNVQKVDFVLWFPFKKKKKNPHFVH